MLAEVMAGEWTSQQAEAIENRAGELFLDAAAGSGKTSVLVERFVRSVLQDGIAIGSILAITFTEKAAAEMRERIRARLRELGAADQARAAEEAQISTIHGFCARVLRTHALVAGVDPGFRVLDEAEAANLAAQAFEEAVEGLAETAEGARLIASYGIGDLRAAISSVYGQLRSRGERMPVISGPAGAPDLAAARHRVVQAASRALRELATVAEPSARVGEAIERLQRVDGALQASLTWPGELDALRLPGGNGAALRTDTCLDYASALAELREAMANRLAAQAIGQLNRLLGFFAAGYERRKRERSGLDFEDLELLSLELLRSHAEVADSYQGRFLRVMVDELQDTNAVQMALVNTISESNLFTVGDAQQSIYAFRHADVGLFEARGEQLEGAGSRATLRVNFRSRPEILEVVNRLFADALGERFVPLIAGRDPAGDGERVEMLVADRGGQRNDDDAPVSWRSAEAAMLANRIDELIQSGLAARDVVVLTRASTEIRVYERALEERGIPTYVIGGRGYWSHPQVIDVLAYLRLLANPLDEEALFTVLVSPLVGISYDSLVLLAAAAREGGHEPWWLLRDRAAELGELEAGDRIAMERFAEWASGERDAASRTGAQELIDRLLERTGYDIAVLRLPGGRRRLANLRKLMRLAREHEGTHGVDLRAFLDLVADRAGAGGTAEEESEAPVEGEALDAVRLMTIHRAKGLEFDVVCVADLGRLPRWGGEALRVATDGRLGVRLARPGTGRREPALAYDILGEELRQAEAREERRLFYVAATRARERLIFSAAADVSAVWGGAPGVAAIGWLGPGLVPDLPGRLERGETAAMGVRFAVSAGSPIPARAPGRAGAAGVVAAWRVQAASHPARSHRRGAQSALSYTSLTEYQRCGYRFYAERILGLAPEERPPGDTRGPSPGLSGAERGSAVHSLLERLDLSRPTLPSAEDVVAAAGRPVSQRDAAAIRSLIESFVGSQLGARLARARAVRREQQFGFVLQEMLVTGALDVLADEAPGTALVVDYKTDRLEGRPPDVAFGSYAIQRQVYALAVLRAGYEQVEVAHVFLERAQEPMTARFASDGVREIEDRLTGLVSGVRNGRYAVTDTPHRGCCAGCPAEGGLCSWPLAMTRRESADSLF